MNERIKQIAEQAGIAVWGDAVYRYNPYDILDSTIMEKFAKLIVRECIEINKQELAFNAFELLMNKYQEHFGVVEQ